MPYSGLDFLEITHGFLDAGQIGERIRKMLDYALKLHNLMLVYHAGEHRFVLVRKASDGRHLRDCASAARSAPSTAPPADP